MPELRLRKARKRPSAFGALWRNPAVPDRLRVEVHRGAGSSPDRRERHNDRDLAVRYRAQSRI